MRFTGHILLALLLEQSRAFLNPGKAGSAAAQGWKNTYQTSRQAQDIPTDAPSPGPSETQSIVPDPSTESPKPSPSPSSTSSIPMPSSTPTDSPKPSPSPSITSTFNLSRYKELLKLEENGKISSLDPLDRELLSFGASVDSQIEYNRKKDYLTLIDKYLSRIISPYEFRSKFRQMEMEDMKKSSIILQDFQKLEVFTLTLAKDREKFSHLMYEVSDLCLGFDISIPGCEPMSEDRFYYLVNNYSLHNLICWDLE